MQQRQRGRIILSLFYLGLVDKANPIVYNINVVITTRKE